MLNFMTSSLYACAFQMQEHILYSFSVPVCLQSTVHDLVQAWFGAVHKRAEDIDLVATVSQKSVLLSSVAL